MAEPATRPRWFVDETSLGLAKILAIARDDVVHPGHRDLPQVPTGTYDDVWMPIVANRGLVVIGRDKKIRTRPAELAAFKALGLRAFWIAGKRDLSNWDNLKLIVKWWERMEELVDYRGPGPWFYAIGDAAIREIII